MKPTQPSTLEEVVTSVVSIRNWRREVSEALDRLELRVSSLERRVALWACLGGTLPYVVELLLRLLP